MSFFKTRKSNSLFRVRVQRIWWKGGGVGVPLLAYLEPGLSMCGPSMVLCHLSTTVLAVKTHIDSVVTEIVPVSRGMKTKKRNG